VALLARPAAERASHMAPPAGPAADVTPQSPDELYREAHEAHFARHDFQAALALWDRYLALTPLPGLAVEARYNRAIALFRLGRRAETRQALRPFADGDYGSYRAAEARALLDALAR
jgi:tetratricopeptide (TPR) repeat protein